MTGGEEAAGRIAALEARVFPAVMIWEPARSITGNWEAQGRDWTVVEASAAAFWDALKARLGHG